MYVGMYGIMRSEIEKCVGVGFEREEKRRDRQIWMIMEGGAVIKGVNGSGFVLIILT